MSLFIGKNNNNRNIIHVTKGHHSEEVLKGAIIEDTVLHNDMYFLGYSQHSLQYVSETGQYSEGSPRFYETYAKSPDSHLMGSSELAYFLDATGKVVNFTGNYTNGVFRYKHGFWVQSTYSSEYCYPCVTSYSGYPSLSYLNSLLVANPVKLINNEGVQIKGSLNGLSQMLVGNFDLGNIRYISKGRINNSPVCPLIDGYHQLINGPAMTGGIEIIADPINGAVIKKGGHILFDGGSSLINPGPIISYNPGISANSSVYLFAVTSGTIHKVVTRTGTIVVTVSGSSSTQVDSYRSEFYQNGQWLSIRTTIRYVISGGGAYLTATTTHSYAHLAELPPTYPLTVQIFSEA